MLSLADYTLETLAGELSSHGYKPSHARTVLRAFYAAAGALDSSALEIGKALQNRLTQEFAARHAAEIARHTSADGTIKLLLALSGGGAVESVLMPAHRPGIAAGCISSQIGCAMGCDFCASTRSGLQRNLSAGEIVEQFLHLSHAARRCGRRLRTLVFMGMGEPMHNLDNVIESIRRMGHPDMGNLGWRQITVSTVGIVPGIDALAAADLNVHLAVSLHAPDDATRSKIVPANRRYGVADVMAAARRFLARTRRVPTIEYCMLAGINDSDDQAGMLAALMEGFRAHVNLIPFNSIGAGISGTIYARPDSSRLMAFINILRQSGVVVHIRTPRGDDVAAACGQLRQMTCAS
jgi:23S rRNA (adenine2503-C2)-methyltransferase